MYTTINFSSFCDEFRTSGRNNNFSYDAKRALFDYLEQLEEDIGEPIELDIISLCCDYSEDPLADVLENYNVASLEELNDHTSIISYDEQTGLVLYAVY